MTAITTLARLFIAGAWMELRIAAWPNPVRGRSYRPRHRDRRRAPTAVPAAGLILALRSARANTQRLLEERLERMTLQWADAT